MEGARRAAGVSPSLIVKKGVYHECDRRWRIMRAGAIGPHLYNPFGSRSLQNALLSGLEFVNISKDVIVSEPWSIILRK